MVLGLKPMRNLIAFDNYLIVRWNQGLAWSSDYKPMRKSALGALHFLSTIKKEEERVLGMLGPLDFLLSIKQSLSCAGVFGLNAWEK